MRPNLKTYLVSIVLAAVVAYGVTKMVGAPTMVVTKSETVYDRALRNGTIRCGYIVYPPYLSKDPNTGVMSGPSYDVAEALAKELSLKLDWVEETGWGTFQEGLKANRFDLMCVPVWQTGGRARVALLSEPVYYNAEFAVARDNDSRFDHDLNSINNSAVRIMVEDNNPVQMTRRMRFPLAQEIALPEMSNAADAPMSVATGKADIYFDNIVNVRKFNVSADTKLKIVGGGQPLRVYGNVFAVKQGEYDFKAALDAAIAALRNSGELSNIVGKYAPDILDGQPSYAEPKTTTAP